MCLYRLNQAFTCHCFSLRMLENAIETLEMNVNKISSNISDEMNENGLRRLRVKFSSIDKVKQ